MESGSSRQIFSKCDVCETNYSVRSDHRVYLGERWTHPADPTKKVVLEQLQNPLALPGSSGSQTRLPIIFSSTDTYWTQRPYEITKHSFSYTRGIFDEKQTKVAAASSIKQSSIYPGQGHVGDPMEEVRRRF